MNKIRTFMMRATIGVFAAGALAAGVPVAPTAGAQAAPDEVRTTFAAQTYRAGLTPAQAGELQAEVDGYLAREEGSRQISANRIAVPGGELTVAAPGQGFAHDLASPAARSALPAACGYGHLCLYRGGDVLDFFRCGTYNMPWTGDGTFNNNQTSGTVARFLNSNRTERWSSRAPQTGTATWTQVYYVVPC
ncbi:hypothetical protein [Streptomyces sp. NPDC091212]|uniref:hypothetical protein n=1 Tax=Streptomyces sp. NPDC091212 TaxID=3155191 RepID=UPI00343964CD